MAEKLTRLLIPKDMQVRARSINVSVARTCIDCAEFAYRDRSAADEALRNAGLTLISWYDHKDTQAFLAVKDGRLYLSFRGTKSLGDWVTDVKYVKTDFPGGGRVHAGFSEAFKWIEEPIARDLEDFPNTPKVVDGHSLGAALAQEASVRFNIPEGYVFGCPRVGNSGFTDRVSSKFHRLEHLTDPVTYLPPRTSPYQVAYALWHFRWPTLYDRAHRAHLLDGNLHRMGHYRPSAMSYLDAVANLQRVESVVKNTGDAPMQGL